MSYSRTSRIIFVSLNVILGLTRRQAVLDIFEGHLEGLFESRLSSSEHVSVNNLQEK